MTTNFDILDRAEKVELLAAELYAAFALHFAAEPTAVVLFRRLRDEEQQHASRIRMLAAQSRHDSKLLGKIPGETRALDDLVHELSSMIAVVKHGEWRAGLVDTRKALLVLEERAARAHAEGVQGLNESLRRFFEQLAAADKAHEELLRG